MLDLFAVAQRAQEIIAERYAHWYEDLQQRAMEAYGAPQRQTRAAFEQVQQADPAEYEGARASFEQQYGSEAWDRQQQLSVRRASRSQERERDQSQRR